MKSHAANVVEQHHPATDLPQGPGSSRMRKWLKGLTKVGLVVGLIYWLVQRGAISAEETRKAFERWDLLAEAYGIFILTTCLGILRWQWLLRAQNIQIPLLRTAQYNMIGTFFNVALPGAISGDFVKAFYIGNEVKNRRGHVFGTIVFDRVAGLSALVFVAAGTLVFGVSRFRGTPLFGGIQVFVAISAAVVVVGYVYLFLVNERRDPVLKFFQVMQAKYEKVGSLTRIYEGMRHYHHHRLTVVRVLALSVVIHLLIAVAFSRLGLAMGEENIELLELFVVVPMGLLVTAVPVAPAGVGTGHAAFLALFALLGSKRGADVFSLYALMCFLTGAIGGLIYLRFRGPPRSFSGGSASRS
ncbi:MAG: lysylphosphatidylglycerol synthase transmembrane domain-containing protein [Bdellovibrionota bacterium]